jgi:hypothetical protein
MSAHVRRIAVLTAAFPGGWSVYPIQATRTSRPGAVPANHDGLPAGGADALRTTRGRQVAHQRACDGG